MGSSLGEFIQVTRETGSADALLDALEPIDDDGVPLPGNDIGRLRGSTSRLHQRLVARCHGTGGIRDGVRLAKDVNAWREQFKHLLIWAMDDNEEYVDWWTNDVYPCWPNEHPPFPKFADIAELIRREDGRFYVAWGTGLLLTPTPLPLVYFVVPLILRLMSWQSSDQRRVTLNALKSGLASSAHDAGDERVGWVDVEKTRWTDAFSTSVDSARIGVCAINHHERPAGQRLQVWFGSEPGWSAAHVRNHNVEREDWDAYSHRAIGAVIGSAIETVANRVALTDRFNASLLTVITDVSKRPAPLALSNETRSWFWLGYLLTQAILEAVSVLTPLQGAFSVEALTAHVASKYNPTLGSIRDSAPSE